MAELARKVASDLIVTDSLVKSFGGARALDGVSLTIRPGEVHGLVGENGSGKSTFIKVLAGFHAPESGTIHISGEKVTFPIRLEALPASTYIGFVHQDLGLVPDLSILENFYARAIANTSDSSLRSKFVPRKANRQHLRAVLDKYEIQVSDLDQTVVELSPLEKAMFAIVRAVDEIARSGAERSLLVLDEPTVYLPGGQRSVLYTLIRATVAHNNSVLIVSHDIDEVLEVADQITVFRDGRVVGTVASAETSRREVVTMMIGQDPADLQSALEEAAPPRPDDSPGSRRDPLVEMAHVRGAGLTDVNLCVHAGEIVGLAGLAGAGHEVVSRVIYGVIPITAGEMRICDGPVVSNRHSPFAALERGVILVPRDRINEGGISALTVNENVLFPIRSKFTRRGIVRWKRAWPWVHEQLVKFDVRPPDGTRELSTLSGGNQQKAIFSKWFQLQPKLMLLEEPTQGVDVGARWGIWGFIRDAAAKGTGILIASSDYEELVELCDRVVVLAAGSVVAELDKPDVSKKAILTACYRQPTTIGGSL